MPRKKIPHFRFYIDDFINGTKNMSAAEVGDYIRLLAHLYDQGGRVPNEPGVLRHLLHCNRVRDAATKIGRLVTLGKLFVDQDGQLHNGRTDKEIERRKEWEKSDIGGFRSPISEPSTKPKKSTKSTGRSTLARATQIPDSTFNKVESGATRRFARERARSPPQDFSSFLQEELRQMVNGHEQHTINGTFRRLEAGNGSAEDVGADPAGETSDAKPD